MIEADSHPFFNGDELGAVPKAARESVGHESAKMAQAETLCEPAAVVAATRVAAARPSVPALHSSTAGERRAAFSRRSVLAYVTASLLGASAVAIAFLASHPASRAPTIPESPGGSPPRIWDELPPAVRSLFLAIDEWVSMKEAIGNANEVHNVISTVMATPDCDPLKHYALIYLRDTNRPSYTNDLIAGLAPSTAAPANVRRSILGTIEVLWRRHGVAAANTVTKNALVAHRTLSETNPVAIEMLDRIVASMTSAGL